MPESLPAAAYVTEQTTHRRRGILRVSEEKVPGLFPPLLHSPEARLFA